MAVDLKVDVDANGPSVAVVPADPEYSLVWEGPVPPIAGRSKPANSVVARASPSASMFDGPFGGKRPQS